MIEEVFTNLYRIEVILPQNPLKYVNAYLIKGRKRFTLVDTGMNRPECKEALETGLSKLGVALDRTDFVITHFHADHVGLVPSLATDKSKLYFNRKQVTTGRDNPFFGGMAELARLHGFPKGELNKVMSRHPGFLYGPKAPLTFRDIRDGDRIEVGDFSYECIETPGHHPNHICLYEPKQKLLISGDHILADITPVIAIWPDQENPLEQYLASLEKIWGLDVDVVLPGHGRVFRTYRKRIKELRQHHEARLKEVLSILEKGGQTGYQVASEMIWNVAYPNWEQFPLAQKWFAVGEALSHLRYLERQGMVFEKKRKERILFYHGEG